MKIAHVTSQICHNSAGLGLAVAGISKATQKAGNEVRVFGLSSPNWIQGDNEIWSGAPASVFRTAHWLGPLGYATEMLPAILDFEPDIVHLHGLWTYPSIAVYQWHRATGRPYIVSAHGMLMPASLSYKSFRKSLARVVFQDRILRKADVLHATSIDEKNAYNALGFHNRIEMILFGLDKIECPVSNSFGLRRRALFLGRLHHQKGLDWLIEAWSKLEHDFQDWDLSIVGPTEQNYAVEVERFKNFVSDKRVSFVGPLYGHEKNTYIAESDLLIMPSRSENLGLVAAESLMLEVPVIASRGTPWSGLIKADAGWWVDAGSSALVAAMRQAMSMSPDFLRNKGRNGRSWVEREFSWDALALQWQHIYEKTASRTSL